MTAVAKTYTFVPGTTIESAQANQNFDDLVNYINGEVVVRDASKAFTSIPTGPATDPSTANQFARKLYTDGVLGFSAGTTPQFTTAATVKTSLATKEKYLAGTFVNNSAVNRTFDQNAWADLTTVTYTPTSTSERLVVSAAIADLYIANFGEPSFFADFRLTKTVAGVVTQLSCGFGSVYVGTPVTGNGFFARGFDFAPAAVSTVYSLQVKCRTAVLAGAHNPTHIIVESLGFSV